MPAAEEETDQISKEVVTPELARHSPTRPAAKPHSIAGGYHAEERHRQFCEGGGPTRGRLPMSCIRVGRRSPGEPRCTDPSCRDRAHHLHDVVSRVICLPGGMPQRCASHEDEGHTCLEKPQTRRSDVAVSQRHRRTARRRLPGARAGRVRPCDSHPRVRPASRHRRPGLPVAERGFRVFQVITVNTTRTSHPRG